jgi:AraC family ethanolamine operon transcriptional activator
LTSDACFDVPATEPFSFHDYARNVCDAGANVMLTKPSRGDWQVTRHPLARIVLQSGATGGPTIADGVTRSGSFVFFLLNSEQSRPVTLNGEGVAIDEIAVFPPGREFALASRGPHKWISIAVPPAVLEEAGFSRVHIHALGAAATPIRAPHAAIRQLVTAAKDAMDAVQSNPASANAIRFCDIERSLLADLAAAIIPGGVVVRSPSCRNNSNLDRVIRQALGFLRAQDGQDLHVEHLCRAIDVAERSLLRAFHRFFGVGPTQYLKLRRLNKVHCALQARDCKETTVTGVLTTWGVTELGRFAGAYKALFGEAPSETLRKKTGAKGQAAPFADESLRRRQARSADAQLTAVYR